MLSFHFSHVLKIGSYGLTKDMMRSVGKIPSKRYSFEKLPSDMSVVAQVEQFCKKNAGKFDHFVLLGIGGSALGARCIADALLPPVTRSRLIILDNVDPVFISDMTSHLNLERTLFIVVSKSGTTPETIAQYFYFRKKIDGALAARKSEGGRLKPSALSAGRENFVFATDPDDGFLRQTGCNEGIRTFDIPKDVGGRFLVLTAASLLPAGLLGIDIRGLLHGGEKALKFRTKAFEFASLQYLLQKKRGVSITVMMPYNSRLSTFSDWYAQLLAESIGKEKNLAGKKVNVGLTPVKALGVTDQHSQIQLYACGPFDKLVVFLEVTKPSIDFKIPPMYVEAKSFEFLHDVSFHELLTVEKRATEKALTQHQRPNVTFSLATLDAEHLGALFMFFELSVAFLAELYGINAFDQPGVELAKELTRKMLS